jgi:hypothetical protein
MLHAAFQLECVRRGRVMNKRLSIVLMCAAIVSGVGSFAQAPHGPGPIASTDGEQPGPPPSTTLRMDGTIGKYNVSAALLSVSTSNGMVQLALSSGARIRQGWRRIDAQALEKLTGYRAAIRYSEADGIKTVESIHVFGKHERSER